MSNKFAARRILFFSNSSLIGLTLKTIQLTFLAGWVFICTFAPQKKSQKSDLINQQAKRKFNYKQSWQT